MDRYLGSFLTLVCMLGVVLILSSKDLLSFSISTFSCLICAIVLIVLDRVTQEKLEENASAGKDIDFKKVASLLSKIVHGYLTEEACDAPPRVSIEELNEMLAELELLVLEVEKEFDELASKRRLSNRELLHLMSLRQILAQLHDFELAQITWKRMFRPIEDDGSYADDVLNLSRTKLLYAAKSFLNAIK